MLFNINPATGALTFKVAPDFEAPLDANKDNTYEVTVTATDDGKPPVLPGPLLTDTETISVIVQNIVDTGPTITSDGGMVTAAITVAEGTTAVTDVESKDTEGSETEGAGLYYSLNTTLADDASAFSINILTGELVFAPAPDFDAKADVNMDNKYQVTVQAFNSAGKMSQQALTVTLTDINEPPTITSPPFFSIAEGKTTNAALKIVGSDPEMSSLTYSISGGADASAVAINSTTGVLTFNTAPDWESPADADKNNQYDVEVTVTDSGTPNLAAVQTVGILVSNVDDAPPSITNDAAITIIEGNTAVADLMTVSDSGFSEGTGLTYSLTGGADQAKFTLNATTGVLAFGAAPAFAPAGDADMNNKYEVSVTVTETGGDATTKAFTVTVNAAVPPTIGGTYSYLNQLVTITQTGGTLLFTNENGQTSTGTIDIAGNIAATDWMLTATINNGVMTPANAGNIDFSNMTSWTLVGTTTTPPKTLGSGFTFGGGATSVTHNADGTLTFTNEMGQTSAGVRTSATTVFATDWNLSGTIDDGVMTPANAGNINWANMTVWTASIPNVAGTYSFGGGNPTVTQTGANAVFTNESGNSSAATVDSAGLITLLDWGITATVNGTTGAIDFSNMTSWAVI